jgi:hypothetical protein
VDDVRMTETSAGPEHGGMGEGELLAEISRSLVQLHKECYGKPATTWPSPSRRRR